MPLFSYQALDKDGNLVKGAVVFENEHSLYKWLKDQGLTLVKLRKSYWRFFSRAKIKPEELIEFSRQMFYILRSGIPLLQGIAEISQNAKNQELKKVLQAIYREIQAGQSLADAFSHHPYVFPRFYTSIIRAGEASGNLDRAFWELMVYLEWLYDIKNKIKQALIYPTIVSILIGIALAVFVTFVIPRLTKFLQELDMPLPFPTRLLIAFNNFITTYWYILLFVFLSVTTLIVISRFSERMLFLWDRYKLKLPYFGKLFVNLVMVRFVKYVGMLYRSGIQVYQTLDLVKEILGNRFYAQKIDKIKRFLADGEALGNSIELAGGFPSLLIRSIKTGETTGNLEEAFEELARYFNDELDRAVKKITTIIEPALLILVAIIILTIVISVLWPIYNTLGRIT
ncbi:MAG: type II secretion system F family protein [Candidatus Desulfofervidaceae bacterium]|nr:type II secretion system F family protein [Candidatus Desulfofervidaceae bacterium]